jgi:hypothetical protein
MDNENSSTPILSGVKVILAKDRTRTGEGGGGVRVGAGRPRGTTTKMNGQQILAAINAVIGKPFEVSLAEGYYDSIINQDRALRQRYEQLILNKVVADKVDMDVTTMGESLIERKQAFESILTTIGANHVSKKDNK